MTYTNQCRFTIVHPSNGVLRRIYRQTTKEVSVILKHLPEGCWFLIYDRWSRAKQHPVPWRWSVTLDARIRPIAIKRRGYENVDRWGNVKYQPRPRIAGVDLGARE